MFVFSVVAAGDFDENDKDTFGFGLGLVHDDVFVDSSAPGCYHEYGPFFFKFSISI